MCLCATLILVCIFFFVYFVEKEKEREGPLYFSRRGILEVLFFVGPPFFIDINVCHDVGMNGVMEKGFKEILIK